MVQLLGAVLVAAGCAWLGFGAAASLSRRAEGLEDMASALALLERLPASVKEDIRRGVEAADYALDYLQDQIKGEQDQC